MTSVLSTRFDNVTGRQHCKWCCDDGMVPAGTHRHLGVDYEMYAPCPACVKGNRIEFPEAGRGPWGADGYWKGEPWGTLAKQCRCGAPTSTRKESQAWAGEILTRLDDAIAARSQEQERRAPIIPDLALDVGEPTVATTAADGLALGGAAHLPAASVAQPPASPTPDDEVTL